MSASSGRRFVARVLSRDFRDHVLHEGSVWMEGKRVWSAGPSESLNSIQIDLLEWSKRQGKTLEWNYRRR